MRRLLRVTWVLLVEVMGIAAVMSCSRARIGVPGQAVRPEASATESSSCDAGKCSGQANIRTCTSGDLGDCTKQCDAGDGGSCTHLGAIYEGGKGAPQDYNRAVQRYQQA